MTKKEQAEQRRKQAEVDTDTLFVQFNNLLNQMQKNFEDKSLWELFFKTIPTAYARDKERAFKITNGAKYLIEKYLKDSFQEKFPQVTIDSWLVERLLWGNSYFPIEYLYKILLLEAQNGKLDSYLRYLERKRPPEERFYAPKRKQLVHLGLIQALQDMLDDKLDILSISMPPGTGKTTLEKFFTSAVIGWYPKEYNLFFSHSGDIARMYYDGVLDIVSDPDTYTWNEIFPNLKVTGTNAKMQQFNVGKYKPFPSLQTTSVGSENAGKVRASKFLLCDDLIGKLEEALNKNTLDKLWGTYSVDARQRKIDKCKEIHIATRWSVHDVIGRLERLYEGNERCRFIAVPDIDPVTGKSNFDFDYNGFSVEFYNDQALAMDDISYRCLYKNEPIEREGLLYTEQELRRYSTMPTEEPDAIISVCDTKAKGSDYFVMPVIYKYGDDFYLVDTMCNQDTNYEVQYEKMLSLMDLHNIQMLEIEANMGGDRIAHEVKKRAETRSLRTNITTKYTETNKETRIIVNAEWVKAHVLFKDKEDIVPKSEYSEFMNQLLTYSIMGKNPHDDVPDAMANFVLFVTRRLYRNTVATVMRSPI